MTHALSFITFEIHFQLFLNKIGNLFQLAQQWIESSNEEKTAFQSNQPDWEITQFIKNGPYPISMKCSIQYVIYDLDKKRLIQIYIMNMNTKKSRICSIIKSLCNFPIRLTYCNYVTRSKLILQSFIIESWYNVRLTGIT